MAFNANELILEKVRSVEEYNTQNNELVGRYTQIEDPSLTTTSDATDVTDALGSPIATFYRNKQSNFSFTNSLFSMDLAASQFGTDKKSATDTAKIKMPVSETLEIAADNTVTLGYVPVGTSGSEVSFVKLINENNTFGDTYTKSTTADAAKKTFTINAASKTITMPAGVTGRVFVNYVKETTTAVAVSNTVNGVPAVRKLLIHAIFHDPCDVNIKYSGVIVANRAQIDPSSIDLSLTMEGKHAAAYKIQAPYCGSENATLFDILVSED